jgi:hypothetical protein
MASVGGSDNPGNSGCIGRLSVLRMDPGLWLELMLHVGIPFKQSTAPSVQYFQSNEHLTGRSLLFTRIRWKEQGLTGMREAQHHDRKIEQ